MHGHDKKANQVGVKSQNNTKEIKKMNDEPKIISRREFEEKIINKAWKDENFKKALLDNPQETFKQLGLQIPESIEIKVVEESTNVLYLVLPVNPNAEELTDEQLDLVAGAGEWSPYGQRIQNSPKSYNP